MQLSKFLILIILLLNYSISSHISIMKVNRRHRIKNQKVKKAKISKPKGDLTFPEYPTTEAFGISSGQIAEEVENTEVAKDYTPLQKIMYGALGVIDQRTSCGDLISLILNIPPMEVKKPDMKKKVTQALQRFADWANIKVKIDRSGEEISIDDGDFMDLNGTKFLPGHTFKSKMKHKFKEIAARVKAKIKVTFEEVKDLLTSINSYFENKFGEENWKIIKAATQCLIGVGVMIGSALLADTSTVGTATIVISTIKYLMGLKGIIDALCSTPKDYFLIGKSLATMAFAYLSLY